MEAEKSTVDMETKALQMILQQCGNRKHVLNISDHQNKTQVATLFNKIDAMVAQKAGGHYSIDSADGRALREKMEAIVERASMRFAEVQTKRRKLKALIEGGKTPPIHLKLVMVGAQWSAKSSAGNTILRKYVFPVTHTRTTVYCEINHSVVADRQLTLVDSPGWFYNGTLQELSEMDKLEIENSMHLCFPGPHAVLLVVGLASAFNASYQRAVQEHMSLFTEEVWKHTIVLFTRGDWLGGRTVEERIESEEGLQWLVEKCGNMYHVLDNTNHSDETQVTELLEKIEEMWAGNKDGHFEVNLGRAEQMEARKEVADKKAKKIHQTAKRQARILKELFRGETQPITDKRVVLIGPKYSGKSLVGNMILCEDQFGTAWMKKEFQDQRRTTMCEKHDRNVAGRNISVVEAPGWFTDKITPDWLKTAVLRSVSMCAPGPNAFLLVVPIFKTFSGDDYKTIIELLMPFGDSVWRHCMVLFTWPDWLNKRSIEEHIATEGVHLKQLVEKCGYRYHAVNCNPRDCFAYPVIELFLKMFDMITRNQGQYFVAEDKMGNKRQPALQWQEEWNRREQELIDRMLKAVAQESEEPLVPSMKMNASMDGAFTPSMSGDVPRDVVGTCWSQTERAKVTEWLNVRFGGSDVTSGVDSMSISASDVEMLDQSLLTDDSQQQMTRFFSDKHKQRKLDSSVYGRVLTNNEATKHRYSI
ncbi:GTPase IMAP family member 8-like isoform X2 [Eleginops maclovinus]|uniref:GTPase IMAP family member 8-like isoform X2 n=1 Tax=Eleginops maclovinus TaxID=56733 RepID=UPI0030800448